MCKQSTKQIAPTVSPTVPPTVSEGRAICTKRQTRKIALLMRPYIIVSLVVFLFLLTPVAFAADQRSDNASAASSEHKSTLNLPQLQVNHLGLVVDKLQDGGIVAPLNTVGDTVNNANVCPTNPADGCDYGSLDDIVRTHDRVLYRFNYNVNPPVDPSEDIIISSTLPDGFWWNILPGSCTGAGSNISADGRTLTCNLGAFSSAETASFDGLVDVGGVADGTVLSFDATIDGANSSPVTHSPDDTTVTASPRFDLRKVTVFNVGSRTVNGVDGFTIRYNMSLAVWHENSTFSNPRVGSEPLTNTIQFIDDVSNISPNAELWYCEHMNSTHSPNNIRGEIPYAKVGMNGSAVPANSNIDSGTITCDQPGGPGTDINVTLNNVDTTLNSFPTEGRAGTPTNVLYSGASNHAINIFVPLQDIVDAGGTVTATNCYTDFEPESISGVTNLNGGGEDTTNNCATWVIRGYDGLRVKRFVGAENSSTPPGTASNVGAGNGFVVPGETFYSRLYFFNRGALPQNNAAVCDVIDNRKYVYTGNFTPSVNAGEVLEVATGYVGSWPPDLTVNSNLATAAECEDPSITWVEASSYSGDWADVTKHRLRATTALPASQSLTVYAEVQALDVDPVTGQPIPNGTVLPNYSTSRSDELTGGDYSPCTYMPRTTMEEFDSYSYGYLCGDRVGLTRGVVRINKSVNVAAVNAGNSVTWTLEPAFSSNGSTAIFYDVTVTDLLPPELTYLQGSASQAPDDIISCTGAATPHPSCTQSGETVLEWVYGNQESDVVLTPITFRTQVDATTPNNTILTNNVVISSPADGSLETDRDASAAVLVQVPAVLKPFKTVETPLELPNKQFQFTLSILNNTADPQTNLDVIDVLPWNGDSSVGPFGGGTPYNDGRTPPSNFTGTLAFNSVTLPAGAQIYYTKDASATIDRAPVHLTAGSANSNDLASGSTNWCLGASGSAVDPAATPSNGGGSSADCPATLAEVTAYRIQWAGPLAGNGGVQSFVLLVDGANNDEPDIYTNNFGVKSAELSLPALSNDVSATVVVPEIGDRVWFDANGDGVQDADTSPTGEPGIAGITVNLYTWNDDGDGIFQAGELGAAVQTPGGTDAVAVTDANGNYYFTLNGGDGTNDIDPTDPIGYVGESSVAPFTRYVVAIDETAGNNATLLAPYLNSPTGGTPASQATSDDADSDGDASLVNNLTIIPTQTGSIANDDYSLDFGFSPDFTQIGNRVWYDTDNDGQLNNSEAGISGVTVELYLDDDNNGLFTPGIDSLVATSTTVAGGYYTFTNLISDTYVVVITNTNFSGAGVLVGYTSSDINEADPDSNGDNNDNGLLSGTLGSGGYVSSGAIDLAPNSEPDGTPGGPGDMDGDSDDNTNWTVDFGFYAISLGNQVWEDYNNNGLQDAGEPGIGSVAVALVDDNGSVVDTTSTDPNGLYTFTGIISGTYVVSITTPSAAYTSSAVDGGAPNTDTTDLDDNGIGSDSGEVVSGPITLTPSNSSNGSTTDNATASTENTLVDFGLFRELALGSQVWFDTDNNGAINGSETGADGVLVQLYQDTDGNGVYTPGTDSFVNSLTTSAGGYYTFTGLISDTYVVVLPSSNFTGAGVLVDYNSSDIDEADPNDDVDDNDNGLLSGTLGSTGYISSGAIDLAPGTEPNGGGNTNESVDFGFYTQILGDTVWEDTNNDGDIDAGEPGIDGVEVRLLDGVTNAVIMTTTTNASGLYTFTGLISDTYKVEIVPPAGYESSTGAGQEADPESDGDNNDNGLDTPVAGAIRSAEFSLTPGDSTPQNSVVSDADGSTNNPSLDFGLYQPLALGNQVWFDINNDGQLNGSEAGISGVDVELYRDSNGDGLFTPGTDLLVDRATTIAGGYYTFTDLISDTYVVVITNTNFTSGGMLVDHNSSAADEADPNDDVDDNDNGLVSGTLGSGGYVSTGAIALAPGSEPNGGDNANWTIDFGFVQFDYGDLPTSYNTDIGNTNAITPAHHTIIDGVYLGSGVDAELDGQPSTDADSDDNSGGEDGVTFLGNPLGDSILLAGQPFTLTVTASTAGYLNGWFDWNNDGDLTDGDENPFSDMALITGTNIITMTVPVGVTADDIYSRFRFSSDDPAGAMGPDGFWPNGEVEDYVTPAIERFSLGNRIWEDEDNDGEKDANEMGIGGVVVNLLNSAGVAITDTVTGLPITTTTDADGYYLFDELPTGDYIIEIDAANFGAGQPLENQQSSTGATQEADPNSDGDFNDNGLDAPISLPLPGPGMGVRSAPVTLSSAAGGEPTSETDLGPDAHGNTSDAYSNLTVDFGFFEPVSVGTQVWYDLDHNGSQDAGENGVEGIDVTLYDAATNTVVTVDADGNAITPLTTDAMGHYTFTNLIPGAYYVVFDTADIPTGYEVTTPSAAGVTDEFDSDANETTGQTDSTGFLASGSENLDLDMGIWAPSSIGETVWFDNDHDGIYEPGENENGVPGIDVVLYDATTGTAIMTTTTNINGTYLFTNLVPGDYYVDFDLTDLPTGYTVTREDVATDPTDESDSDTDPNTGETHVVSLGPGESNLTLDMGIYAKVSVGDRVWYDDDYDGVQDATEAGVSGIDVTLYDSITGLPVTADADGTPITPQTTNGDGYYLFSNLPPGNYHVVFDLTDLPAGYQVTKQDESGVNDSDDSDADPSSGQSSSTGMLLATEADMTLDMGIWTTVSVGDTVWYDNDGDGIQDSPTTPGSAEPGVPNVTVTLLDSAGNPVLDANGAPITDVTDSNGNYEFTGLIPGSYAVAFDPSTLPAGYGPTTANAGSDDELDSDADPTTLQTPPTDFLLGGEEDLSLDLGLVAPVSLGDTVWYDNNRDGVQDANESGVENVTVTLLDGNGSPVTDSSGNALTTVTDGDGFYEFTNLPPGEYMVEFDLTSLPAGYVPTAPNQGGDDTADSDASASTGRTAATDFLSATERDETLDMGIIQLGEVRVGDYVWEDLNADGLQDAGEPGVENVLVTLYFADGTPTGLTTLTDSSGFYLFDGLDPQDYYVEFSLNTLPSGYQVTTQDVGDDALDTDQRDSDVDPATGRTPATGFLNDGEQDLSLDLGIWTPASLGDTVWLDRDADGIQEAGEPGVANVTVNLLDADGNPVLDGSGNPLTTVTDINGRYVFTGLVPGGYVIEFDPPPSMVLTSPDGGNDDTADSDADPTSGRSPVVTLESGEHNPTIDAGLHEPTSIGNFIWEDLDADGTQDSGEPGVEDVTVRLYDGDGNLVDTTTTDSNGFYGFNGLTPGDYYVEVVPPTDMILTQQDAGSDDTVDSDADPTTGLMAVTTLDSGEDDPTWDAGLIRPASIGDTVWFDENGNGIQDANEPGVENVTVSLYMDDVIETLVDTTLTDSNGDYEFTQLVPGDYFVSFDPPPGYSITQQDAGSNDALDSDVDPTTGRTESTTLEPGEHDPTWDVGLVQLASLGDTVWFDTDRDGTQGGGEMGVAGILVNLLDGNGNPVLDENGQPVTTTTDGSGTYEFTGLVPGDYRVRFDVPAGYLIVPADQGGNDAFDSDADATGLTPVVTLAPGEHNPTIDLGLVLPESEPASIGDYVWYDENEDGVQDSNESGIPGVLVTLYDGDGNMVAEQLTDEEGGYLFENLLPGDYSVGFTPPFGYRFTSVDAGGDTADSDANDSDADPTTGRTPVTTLDPGEAERTVDGGLVLENPPAASIGNYVWFDMDQDGIQDDFESGIPGVEVTLYRVDENGNEVVVHTMTTDSDGSYLFDNLPAADYRLTFTPPAGYLPSLPNQGSDDGVDSDADPITGRTPVTTLSPGENDMSWDAGFNLGIDEGTGESRLPASVGNYIWEDTNRDGVQDSDEVAMADVIVELYSSDGVLIATTETDENGNYLFPNLVPGPYYIQFTPPTNYGISPVNTTERSNDSDVNPETGRTQVLFLEAGVPNLELDAGFYPFADDETPNSLDETNEPTSLDEQAEPDAPGNLLPELYLPLFQ